MTGMIRIISIIFLTLILSGCMKTTCLTDTDCEKKVDWNDPGFTVLRTIITNGANAGN
jgi:PBP1b-binding outer membrane lipoprotein LpoB